MSSIAIIGAGPAGLVAALSLARQCRDNLTIDVFEQEEDHEHEPTYNPDRSYTIDITGHGLRALKYCEATDRFDTELIQFAGLNVHRPLARKVPWESKGWTGSRGDICRALLQEIREKHPGAINFHFNTAVQIDDIFSGTLSCTATGEQISFDLIIACDGAGSTARGALQAQLPGFTVQKASANNYCTMLHLDGAATRDLDPRWLEVFNLEPFVVGGAINGPGGKDDPLWFCMVGFDHMHTFVNAADAKRYLRQHGGERLLEFVTDREIDDFIQRPCSNIGRSKLCSQYHGGRLVLVGDSGNPFPPIGQGVNHAMEAAVELDREIGRALQQGRSLETAAVAFTSSWKPQGDAINWIARRTDFGSRWKMFLLKLSAVLGISVLNEAKSETLSWKQVRDAAIARQKSLGFGTTGEIAEKCVLPRFSEVTASVGAVLQLVLSMLLLGCLSLSARLL